MLDAGGRRRIFGSNLWRSSRGFVLRHRRQDSLNDGKNDMTENATTDLTEALSNDLPYLRRYARALTGSQARGDQYALATLEAVMNESQDLGVGLEPRVALFRVFHSIWISAGASFDADDGAATRPLARLSPGTREALLLNTIEEMGFAEIGAIMAIDPAEAKRLVDIAYTEMAKAAPGKVMVIEDEAIIAADLEDIVSDMGHRITGVAGTEEAAIALAAAERPDLILSDIQLADLSSGMDAVERIAEAQGPVPVVFITAYPERLLTGTGPEPAFVIAKPYREEQVRSAVSQAMFLREAAG
jgi:CheY-like chemotaxis protein